MRRELLQLQHLSRLSPPPTHPQEHYQFLKDRFEYIKGSQSTITADEYAIVNLPLSIEALLFFYQQADKYFQLLRSSRVHQYLAQQTLQQRLTFVKLLIENSQQPIDVNLFILLFPLEEIISEGALKHKVLDMKLVEYKLNPDEDGLLPEQIYIEPVIIMLISYCKGCFGIEQDLDKAAYLLTLVDHYCVDDDQQLADILKATLFANGSPTLTTENKYRQELQRAFLREQILQIANQIPQIRAKLTNLPSEQKIETLARVACGLCTLIIISAFIPLTIIGQEDNHHMDERVASFFLLVFIAAAIFCYCSKLEDLCLGISQKRLRQEYMQQETLLETLQQKNTKFEQLLNEVASQPHRITLGQPPSGPQKYGSFWQDPQPDEEAGASALLLQPSTPPSSPKYRLDV